MLMPGAVAGEAALMIGSGGGRGGSDVARGGVSGATSAFGGVSGALDPKASEAFGGVFGRRAPDAAWRAPAGFQTPHRSSESELLTTCGGASVVS